MKTRVSMLFAVVIIIVLCSSPTAADDSVVLYFSFDEGGGNDVKDSSPAQNDGTVDGDVKWVAGKIGKAMRFDGKGFVEVPHAENLNLTKAHTISYWLKWDGQGASWSPFISKTSGGGPKEDNFHTWIGKDKIWDYENQPNGQTHGVTKIALEDEWMHLTVTHDGDKTVSFYINGEKDDATNQLPTTDGNDVNVHVGDDGKGNKGAGTIDELVIFQRALTDKEIKSLVEVGVEKFLAVEQTDKLTTTWGDVKNRF